MTIQEFVDKFKGKPMKFLRPKSRQGDGPVIICDGRWTEHKFSNGDVAKSLWDVYAKFVDPNGNSHDWHVIVSEEMFDNAVEINVEL